MKPSARPKASGIPCLKLQQGGSVPDHLLRGNVVRNIGRTIVRPGEVNNRFKSQLGEQGNSLKLQTGEWNSRFRAGVVDYDNRFRNQIREQDSRLRNKQGDQSNRLRTQIGDQGNRLRTQIGEQENRLRNQIGGQNILRNQQGEQEKILRNNTGEQNNRFRTQILRQDNNFKNQVVEQNQIEKEKTQVCDGERTAKIEKQSKETEDVEKEKVPGKDCIGTEHGRSLHNDNAETGEQSTELVASDDKVSCDQTEKTSNIIQVAAIDLSVKRPKEDDHSAAFSPSISIGAGPVSPQPKPTPTSAFTRVRSPNRNDNQNVGSLSLRANTLMSPVDLSAKKKRLSMRRNVITVSSERYQEALLDDECALYSCRLQSPCFTGRSYVNPVATVLQEGDEMHFIPIQEDSPVRHYIREGSAFSCYSP
ncbi:Hypothetical predicted protein [Mytilus galloprovincialis]|uniref:Uncharacterized protein n=1 Tax=Mytilus galloprovincialis TaxID=29158 RepID=A0A8B6EXN4_MYTGA|nr:Hypothetical predicted protein [Mytilus galloprovincialis]